MNKVQKRKFTLALNGLLRARKDFHAQVNLPWDAGRSDRAYKVSETKRKYLYRVVDELTKQSK